MSYRFLAFLLLMILSFSQPSHATDQGAKYPTLYVSDPWSFEAVYQESVKKYGDRGFSSRQLARNQGLLEFLYFPPFNILSLIYFKTIGRDSDSIALEATKLCKTEENMERKISCLTHHISAYAKSLPHHSGGITYDYRTFCAIAANLFFKSFNSLTTSFSIFFLLILLFIFPPHKIFKHL